MVPKDEAKKGANNVENGDFNPAEIENFIDFSAKPVKLFTTDKVIKHFPKVGTEINLHPDKAEKWIENGYATKEKPAATAKGKKGAE